MKTSARDVRRGCQSTVQPLPSKTILRRSAARSAFSELGWLEKGPIPRVAPRVEKRIAFVERVLRERASHQINYRKSQEAIGRRFMQRCTATRDRVARGFWRCTHPVVRPILDTLWQSFDEPRCWEYDSQGRWNG